jgi:hypothetical protein
MKKNSFNIFRATASAYRFVGQEWRYLLGIGLLPATATFATALFLQMQEGNQSLLVSFLWNIPATIFSAWFMFQETRLIIFGERIDKLPKDKAFQKKRHDALQASALVWLLFNMAVISITSFVVMTMQANTIGKTTPMTVVSMFLMAGMIWAIRFGVAHIVVAVGYPLKKFILDVNGVIFSFCLIGMSMIASLPVVIVLGMVTEVLIDPATPENSHFTVFIAISAVLSTVITAVVNAGAVFGLKDLLGKPERRK